MIVVERSEMSNYQDWQNDPCPETWRKSGYNPRANYGVMRLEEHRPLDWVGALMMSVLTAPFWVPVGYFLFCLVRS